MENPCGARLEFWHQDGKFGLGSFYYKGVRAGAEMDQFLYEDSHYVWDKYQADRYEIVENTPQKGVITFYGHLRRNQYRIQLACDCDADRRLSGLPAGVPGGALPVARPVSSAVCQRPL